MILKNLKKPTVAGGGQFDPLFDDPQQETLESKYYNIKGPLKLIQYHTFINLLNTDLAFEIFLKNLSRQSNLCVF